VLNKKMLCTETLLKKIKPDNKQQGGSAGIMPPGLSGTPPDTQTLVAAPQPVEQR
jgi:hypothetical protein